MGFSFPSKKFAFAMEMHALIGFIVFCKSINYAIHFDDIAVFLNSISGKNHRTNCNGNIFRFRLRFLFFGQSGLAQVAFWQAECNPMEE